MVSNSHEDQIVVYKEVTQNEEQKISSMQLDDDSVENEGDVAENILVNICDTCGDLGWERSLAICDKCGVGAEHIYCMAVKNKKIPDKWHCYDCIEDKDGEIGSRKRKAESFTDCFEISERRSNKRRPDLLKTQTYYETVGMDLNQDAIPDLNEEPIPDLNVYPIPDLNVGSNLILNPDLNQALSLGPSSSSCSSSPSPFLGQHYLEEGEHSA